MTHCPPPAAPRLSQDDLWRDAMHRHGRDVARFAAGYERDPARRQELLQEIHVALWQSFAGFRGQCALRTWVYRVAHNVGATHVQRRTRDIERACVGLEDAEHVADAHDGLGAAERRMDLARVLALVHRLAPLDRQVILLWLEDLDAAGIGEVTGLSARNVATKVHRIKALLAAQVTHDAPGAPHE